MEHPLPNHIAFIMDGNGRWAGTRRLQRIQGHERGAQVLREITEYCCAQGVKEITFFALSTENFSRRPRTEIRALMRLLVKFLRQERPTIARNDIRLRAIGRTSELPVSVQKELETSLRESEGNQGMILRLALNYGSRQEIFDGLLEALEATTEGRLDPEELRGLGEDGLRRFLYDPDMTDPDLLIRTSGEFRLSNFLLWQLSYTELYFCDVAWPDFTTAHLLEAIHGYRGRERKFGRVTGISVGRSSGPVGGELA